MERKQHRRECRPPALRLLNPVTLATRVVAAMARNDLSTQDQGPRYSFESGCLGTDRGLRPRGAPYQRFGSATIRLVACPRPSPSRRTAFFWRRAEAVVGWLPRVTGWRSRNRMAGASNVQVTRSARSVRYGEDPRRRDRFRIGRGLGQAGGSSAYSRSSGGKSVDNGRRTSSCA